MIEDIYNTTLNLSGLQPVNARYDPRYVCELNQYLMLDSLKKLPVILFVFITIALAAVLFHIYIVPLIPALRDNWLADGGVMLAMGALVWAWILSLALTFRLSQGTWEAMEFVSILGVVVVGGFWVYKRFRKV